MQSVAERIKTLDFLKKVNKKVYWETHSLTTSLSEYWREIDDFSSNTL